MITNWPDTLTNSFDDLQIEDVLTLDFPDPTESVTETGNTRLQSEIDNEIMKGILNTDKIASLLLQCDQVVLDNYAAVAKILNRIGYSKDSPQMKLQKAVNSSIQEMFLEKVFFESGLSFSRKSTGIFNGVRDKGVDFEISNIFPNAPLKVEAKMYGSISSMEAVCKNRSKDFHDADLVCCYILTGFTRWCWLYKDSSGLYRRLGRLPKFITSPMPELSTCECIAGSAEEPWIIQVY